MGKNTIVINSNKKNEAEWEDLANQLAITLYGKPLKECLGSAQSLNCCKFQNSNHLSIRVELSSKNNVTDTKSAKTLST